MGLSITRRALFIGLLFSIFGVAVGWLSSSVFHEIEKENASAAVVDLTTAGTEYLANFRCPRDQNRMVLTHGSEDNFSALGDEPAVIRSALLKITRYREMNDGKHAIFGHRDYDEGGADKLFIDSFEFPRGILSGKLIVKMKPAADNRNDTLVIGDMNVLRDASDRLAPELSFATDTALVVDENTGKIFENADGLTIIDFETLHSEANDNSYGDFLKFANSRSRPDDIDLFISDDTIVDFAALALCLEPSEARSVTLVEHFDKPAGGAFSHMSCALDVTQSSCNPFVGDHLCSVPSPIACYKDGNKTEPKELLIRSKINQGAFVGGEVRLSTRIVPARLKSLSQANQYCASQFGKGWRVLSFHEALGSEVASFSKIAPKSRAIVHVGDRAYGNCWDRPETVVGP